ncbi:cytochrome P450 [Artomyces pyxidatus]|uniref:Cytochrome P450 n=1 Tax=Artomyces pyxidatus TaxID=48021 RepID=A0ACB8SMC8_9AGAM|nr:cytochrome P450 [Artomyces pyxidatus]
MFCDFSICAFPIVSQITGAVLIIVALVTLFLFVHVRLRQSHLWNIPGPPAASLIKGHHKQMFNDGAVKFYEHISRTYGGVVRLTGFLGVTQLLISDPKACTSILLKDQDVFEETDFFIEINRHSFGPGLLSTAGPHHRQQRKLLNPVFSVKHMRSMVPIFHDITRQLCDVLSSRVKEGPKELDTVDYLGRLALELIAQGGLGYTFNSLDIDAQGSEFARVIKQFGPSLSKLVFWRSYFPMVSRLPPNVLRFAAACMPSPSIHNLMRITDTLHENTKKILDEKKALLHRGDAEFTSWVAEGRDVIGILLRANTGLSEEEKLPEEEILAQMTTLLLAATDTTSTALSRILHLLSGNSDVQETLRQELVQAYAEAGENELDYDKLVELPYLEAVCRETLRVYPPVTFVNRVCRADISIPLSRPVQTGQGAMSTLLVPRDTVVLVNILGINRDRNIWGADADQWKPERWLKPLPESVSEARIPGVYANTLTFIGGGRACIGFKFSQLEMKVALSQLIRSFRFSPAKQEVVWRFGGITTPSVKGATALAPKLPLVVEKL